MLEQILRDMWIDPELLAELGDDQKQILFCKMREEQLRRWKIRDQQENVSAEPHSSKKVKFLLGADGEPWTWVMGEHPDDKSIELILEEEAREKARKLAEKEALEFRKSVQVELSDILEMNEEQIVELETTKELNRLKQVASPVTMRRKFDKSQAFSEPNKTSDILKRLSHEESSTVAAAVAKWEKKVTDDRTNVIFSQLRREQERQRETDDVTEQLIWKEQEKKAKEAESQIREIARRAREEHRRSSVKEDISESPGFNLSSGDVNGHEALLLMGSTCRPPSKASILEWFRTMELDKKAGVSENGTPEPWFHGLISRQEAEELLSDNPVGSFLVRLSERIWGYAISFKACDRCKHYLIDASGQSHYQFLGSHQPRHASLGALINFHRTNAITSAGGEYLLYPCSPRQPPPEFSLRPPS